MMTQIQPGVQQPLQNASSQILINASTSVTNSSAQTTTSLPSAPYYRPGIPYHIFQNVVLPAFNNTPGSLKTDELQTTIPTSAALSVPTSSIPPSIIKTELPPIASALKTDINSTTEFCPPTETQQIAQTTNIKSEFGSQTVLAMPSEVGAGNTVISSGQLNNLLLSTPAQLQTQLLDTTQIQTQNQPILLPLPIHLQQTQLPLQEQLLDINSTQITTAGTNDGSNIPLKKKKKPKSQTSYKTHNCTQCSYTCNRADKLRVHIMGVHNNDKPFKCDYCEKSFKQRDKLSRHTHTVHFRERPYACDYCPLAFGRKDKVKRHISTVHLGERPYRCNFCPHKTSRKDKMRIHLQQVHQSINGSEHFMIDRAPQPPPRVIPGNNTNRNISDIVGIVSNQLPPPPPAALPTIVAPNGAEGIGGSIVNSPSISSYGSSATTQSVTLTPVPAQVTNVLSIPSSNSSSNTIGSVTLTPVSRSNTKSVTLTPVVVQQQGANSLPNEPISVSSASATNFGQNALNQLSSLPDSTIPNASLPNISLPTIPDSSTITMIANSLPAINLTTTLNNSLSNPMQTQLSQSNIIDNLPTSLTPNLPTLTLTPNFVSNIGIPSSVPMSLSTSTNSLSNSIIQNLPHSMCNTNPVNHTILTNVLNNVNEGTNAVLDQSNHQLSHSTAGTVHISQAQNNMLSSNVIPLIVTKIEENTVH